MKKRFPHYPHCALTDWYDAQSPAVAVASSRVWRMVLSRTRWRTLSYVLQRATTTIDFLDTLDVVVRTCELARLFGINFFNVLNRGSQFRVESMMLRLAKQQNYLLLSPSRQQVSNQHAPECIPLVMEPISMLYQDPVIVLDFQSLYPSIIIAYNIWWVVIL